MFKLSNSFFFLVILTFTFNAAFTVSVNAQTPSDADVRMQFVMNENTNIEEFRAEMNLYLDEMINALRQAGEIPAVRARFGKKGINAVGSLDNAKTSLAKMSPEELVKMRNVYAKFPGWRDAPRQINSVFKIERRGNSPQQTPVIKNSDVDSSDFITPDGCPNISLTPSFADIAIAKGFEITADAVMEALPTDFISILAREISVGIRAGLKAGVLAAETLKNQYDDCHGLSSSDVQGIVDGAKTEIINNDNGNTTTLMTSIDNAKSTIINNDNSNKSAIISNATTNTSTVTTAVTNAQTSINNTSNNNTTALTTAITDARTAITSSVTDARTAIINNDNSNKTSIVNNDNANALTLNNNLTTAKNTIIANDNTNTTNIVNNDNTNTTNIVNNSNANTLALNDLILRSQIEADLATESNGVKVAWYMTPTANGGKLDLVKQIVTLTLANIQAAGGSIGNAQSFLTQANADKAAGNFKSAYDNYRKAYKAAAN